ncbi:MAG TPA: spermidine/putrescine ABC transporter substrate-binding protein [Gaiellaceae bacterium]|jgi:spermidine/putrescine transport system substrate-binding protein|nr:spermidine/putrescine ABC transporter substrate-binding protein [Gaiellaceae bacterium]
MTDHITRRAFLRRAAAGGSILTVPGLLAACGGGSSGPSTAGGSTVPHKLAKTLHFSNWTLYIDKKGNTHPSLDQFQKKYGVTVDYTEDINDNESFFSKIEPNLQRGQSTGRDLIVMTDNSRYPALLVQKGWVEKLDKSAIPNIKNLIPQQRHPSWDPNRDYSLPWQSGFTGIGWNEKLTDPITSMGDLLGNKKLKGKVGLLTEFSDTLALVMGYNGDDPSKITDKTFNKAIDTIQKAVHSGQIRQFYGNDYAGALANGDLTATMAWSGDIVQLQADNPHLKWQQPDTGGDIWTDNMLIPKGGNVYTASVYMNFVYDPKIAAEIEDYVNYVCPVLGAKEALLKKDPAIAKNTLIFPTKKELDMAHTIDPAALNNEKYQTTWQNLISA